ncbi:Rpn family recombination-promoting nuclease/putative transposase [Salinispirillum marinum]|uniref:Rpn family recombination-promoting nuclease/putative transposase n=2 Tax=Saccharospirillaceae TaxID=255527 RepID=A0ABV8BGG7_9GAMM
MKDNRTPQDMPEHSGISHTNTNAHDESYKLLFSEPEMVADLLRGYVHEPWVAQLDFNTLEPVKNDYITKHLKKRQNDCLWKIRWQDEDRWLYVFLMLEFQSSVDPTMAVRIMTYLGLLYQELHKQNQLTPAGKLPPVLPLVLYNGERTWHAATDIADLIDDVPGGLQQYKPQLHYLLLDESQYRDDPLPEVRNLVSALFGLENCQQPDDVKRVLHALLEWVKHPEQRSIRQAFLVWLKQVFLPGRLPGVEFAQIQELHEVQSMLAERVKDWTRSWKMEGIQEGRLEGEAILLKKLLTHRFGTLPAAIEQRLTQASSAELESWAENILDAKTLEEVFTRH